MDMLSNDSMKPWKLKIHLEMKQEKQYSMRLITKWVKERDGIWASYEISKIIAKAGKPHNIGETVIPQNVSIIISSGMKQNENEITKPIPLSKCSVSRHIDVMAEDV